MSFLRDYELYSSGNKSAPVYHLWSGISTMASLLSRRVWVQQGFFTLYPNLYIILVGDPGSAKSHAMNYSRKLIREFAEITVAPDSITKEALTQFMAGTAKEPSPCRQNFFNEASGRIEEYCHVTIFSNEIVTLLGAEPIRMIDFLTDIWDQASFTVKTKNQGTDVIVGPFINILGCMTPEKTSGLLKTQIISGGFSRRCIFVNSTARGKGIARPQFTPAQEAAFERLKTRALWLSRQCGQFTWHPDAEAWFDEWYEQKEAELLKQTDTALKDYYSTKDGLVLKVAMCVALSESDDLILTKGALVAALAMLDAAEVHLAKVFEGTGRNELAPVTSQIADFIRTSPEPISAKALRGAFWGQANFIEMSSILHQLQSIGVIQIWSYQGKELIGTPEQASQAASLAKQAGAQIAHQAIDVPKSPSPGQR